MQWVVRADAGVNDLQDLAGKLRGNRHPDLFESLKLVMRGLGGPAGLPALGIAGTEDGSTPPDMVREALALIPGSEFHLIRRAGHLPCVDQPAAFAATLTGFLDRIGHLNPAQPLPPHIGTH
jgi:pimeloyl-ACP methyl ester carboxylesterase